jgi:iron complex outermembrane receptor protein
MAIDRMRALLCGAAISALAVAAPASAQDTAQPQAQPGQPTSNAGADPDQPFTTDIVVTAQKREQSLQDVPISIEVVSGKTIQDFAATNFRDVMNIIPNVFVQSTAGNDTIYIRGFGSPPANFSFDQSVSLYVDGVYAGRNRQAMAPFFDLARVEVLRGPQGALFGKNTPAGAVSVVSAGPTSDFGGALTALYNFDFKGYDVQGHVSGPISDTLGFRIAGRIQDQDGYIRNLATGNKDPKIRNQLVRATLRWEPTNTFDITAKAEYGNYHRRGGITVSSALTNEQRPKLTRYLEDSALGQEGDRNRSFLTSATANLDIGTHTLTSVTGYSHFKSAMVNGFDQQTPTGAIVPNSVYNSYPEKFSQFSQEVRLLSPVGGFLEYVVGAYYDTSKYKLDQLGGFNIAALNYFGLLHTFYRQNARTYSVFGQATVRPVENVRVIGSLRYTSTHKEGDFRGKLEYGPFALRPVNTVAVGQFTEGLLDPSATIQFDATPDIMFYATYGRGSKSGGFVSNTYGTTSATFRFRPERSTNYEVGMKGKFFDNHVDLNLAAYNTQFKDLQVSVYNPTTSTYLTGNAASATSKGIEAELRYAPSRNFDIAASGAYQDLKYDDYPGAACLASQPITVCNPAVPASIAANNLAGYRPVLSSKFTGNVRMHAMFEMGPDLKFDGTAVYGGRTRYFDSDNQSPIFGYQKGYGKLDLRLQVSPLDERWHVAFVGKNLTNELTTGSSFNLPAPITSVPRAILYLEPSRNIAVEAGVKF